MSLFVTNHISSRKGSCVSFKYDSVRVFRKKRLPLSFSKLDFFSKKREKGAKFREKCQRVKFNSEPVVDGRINRRPRRSIFRPESRDKSRANCDKGGNATRKDRRYLLSGHASTMIASTSVHVLSTSRFYYCHVYIYIYIR